MSAVDSSQERRPIPETDRLWTPAAKALARLRRVGQEDPGSMQHFTTALVVADLLIRLHTAAAIAMLEQRDEIAASRFSFELVRESGVGAWTTALRRITDYMGKADSEWFAAAWLRRPVLAQGRESSIASDLAELNSKLIGSPKARPLRTISPLAVMDFLVEIRNKTVHGAYGSRFYEAYVAPIDDAVGWIASSSPLWELPLITVVDARRRKGRVLSGPDPTTAIDVPPGVRRDDVILSFDGGFSSRMPLVQAVGDYTYVANGNWRVTDTSGEFLSHSLAAEAPGEGIIRRSLPELARPPLPIVGDVVDQHFEITTVLGQGEEAVVYLARDVVDPESHYVLKTFKEHGSDDDQRLVESAALKRFSHPAIPQVCEVLSWEAPFQLRFDYVPGLPIEKCRAAIAGKSDECIYVGLSVLSALQHIHDCGYVHRDLAPDNILVPDDAGKPIRLIDFDLVAPIGIEGVAGTSNYRPPESEQGLGWTARSDIYSLAVLLFELLTGRLPYDPHDEGAKQNMLEPSAKEVARFGKELLEVLLRGASPPPSRRYRSARAFSMALKRVSRDRSIDQRERAGTSRRSRNTTSQRGRTRRPSPPAKRLAP